MSVPRLHTTRTNQAVLVVLRDHFGEELWGHRICQLTALPSGTVYPILTKLEILGWAQARWDTSEIAGPRRRFYEITPTGLQLADQFLGSEAPTFFPSLRMPTVGPVQS